MTISLAQGERLIMPKIHAHKKQTGGCLPPGYKGNCGRLLTKTQERQASDHILGQIGRVGCDFPRENFLAGTFFGGLLLT